MKKTILPLAALALIATSCANDDELDVNFESKTEIRPTASISLHAQTRAIEEGTAFAGNNSVCAVTALRADGSAYINNLPINKNADNTYSFSSPQYFPSDGTALDFYAYSPVITDAAYSGTVATWTLDGTQDILWASGGNHRKVSSTNGETPTQSQPNFVFAHKLALLNINIVKGTGFSEKINITSMKVLAVKNNVSLDLTTGVLTPKDAADATNDINVPQVGADHTDAITDASALYGRIMLPKADSYQLLITTTGGITYPTVTLNPTEGYKEGFKYDVTLTFNGTEITPTYSIKEWAEGGEVQNTVQ